jgi:hypothetical protein
MNVVVMAVSVVVHIVGIFNRDGCMRNTECLVEHVVGSFQAVHGLGSPHVSSQSYSVTGNTPDVQVVYITGTFVLAHTSMVAGLLGDL